MLNETCDGKFDNNEHTFLTILALGYDGGDILQIGSPLEKISQIVVASAHMSACGLRFADSRFEWHSGGTQCKLCETREKLVSCIRRKQIGQHLFLNSLGVCISEDTGVR